MAHTPKEKKRLLPDDILEKSDGEVAEKLFGKEAKEELDRLIGAPVDTPEKSAMEKA